MKILVSNYTFDASEKKITFTDYNPIVIERVLLITNITDNIIIYNFADPTKGGTAATNVLTLTYDTTSMSDTDKLQIFYDDSSTTQPISGTVTANAGTNLNTSSLATSAKQLPDNHQVTVSNIASTPVITGFATSAKQDTGNTSIASIDNKTPALGQALAAASVPVILPAATISTLTPPAAITNFANETGGNLASIKTNTDKIPSLGQALGSASVPVVLPTAQITTLTPPAAITGYSTETTLAAINNKMVSGTDIGDVTINNASGVAAVNIQDGGNSITVDGTVAVTNDGINTIAGAVSGTEMQVDVVAALPAGTNNIGDVDVLSVIPGTGATNLGKAEDSGHSTGDVGVMMLGVRNEGHDDFSGTDKDYVPIATDATGDVYANIRHSLPSGTSLIGKVGIDQTTPGTTNKVSLGTDIVTVKTDQTTHGTTDKVASDLTLIKGTATSVGNGTANNGCQRVTIASDNTAFSIIASGNIAHDSADSGNPIKIGGRASTTPVTAVAANDRVDAFFDVQGRQVVSQKALTATLSNVNGSASSVTLLAANTARLGATIVNDSTVTLYVKFGATASTTSYTVKLMADAYYEVPFGYYGIIDGIWASATGVARVTEIT